MLEIETRDLLKLQKKVDGLVKKNSEKEKVLKRFENLENQNVSVEQKQQEEVLMEVEVNDDAIHVSVEEAVVDEERCEAEEIQKATIEYAQKCLTQVEINKIKKNSPDLGTRLREGFKKKKKS